MALKQWHSWSSGAQRCSEMLRGFKDQSLQSLRVYSVYSPIVSYCPMTQKDGRMQERCHFANVCEIVSMNYFTKAGIREFTFQQSSVQKLTSQTIGSKPDRPRIFTFCYFCSYLINLFNLVAFPFVDIRLCSLPPDGRTPDDTLGMLFLAQRASNQCQNGKNAEALGRQL